MATFDPQSLTRLATRNRLTCVQRLLHPRALSPMRSASRASSVCSTTSQYLTATAPPSVPPPISLPWGGGGSGGEGMGGLASGSWGAMSSGSSSLNGEMSGRAASPSMQHESWRVDKVEAGGSRSGGARKGGEDWQVRRVTEGRRVLSPRFDTCLASSRRSPKD